MRGLQIPLDELIALREQHWSLPRLARHFRCQTAAVSMRLKRHAPHLRGFRGNDRVYATGACEICGTVGRLDADHDHANTKQRGLLCRSCNQGLGDFKDNPVRLERAAAYLRRYEAVSA
jgi:hypothetical protein